MEFSGKTTDIDILQGYQLRSLIVADSKLQVRERDEILMRCRADGRVKESRFCMTPHHRRLSNGSD